MCVLNPKPYMIFFTHRASIVWNCLPSQLKSKLSYSSFKANIKVARLDFFGGYLPSVSINYVAMSKDMGKRLPELYYVKMKISYDLGFIAIGVAMAT